MQRSRSWPQLANLEETVDRSLCGPDKIMGLLQEKLSNWGIQSNSWDTELQLLEEEHNNLRVQNFNLLQKNRTYSEEVLLLESERDEFRLQVEELQSHVAALQKDLRQADREKKIVSEELKMQQEAFIDIESSKKELEKQLILSREALTLQRDEIENNFIHEAFMESDYLRQQLQTMERQLEVKKDAKEVQMLRIENKEIQAQIGELIRENVALTRQLGEIRQLVDRQEQQNLELQVELDKMKISSINCTTAWSEDKMLACTPEPICLADEVNEVLNEPCTQTPQDIKVQDALEEYIRLSAAAVKICYPNVWVSCKELIKTAKTVPFYRVHEVLSRLMMERIQKRHVCRQEVVKKAKI